MPRPSQVEHRRKELLPKIAETFSQLGYRQATTALLAARCNVRENILYRLWKDKKAMFVASLDNLFESRRKIWKKLLDDPHGTGSRVERLISCESENRGETPLHRLIFAALGETNDPDIRAAMRRMYRRYYKFLCKEIDQHRGGSQVALDTTKTALAIIGVVTATNVLIEFDLAPRRSRRFVSELLSEVSWSLLGDGKT